MHYNDNYACPRFITRNCTNEIDTRLDIVSIHFHACSGLSNPCSQISWFGYDFREKKKKKKRNFDASDKNEMIEYLSIAE